jgi:hypothetical protein
VPEHDFTAQRVEWGRQLTGDAIELLERVESPQNEKLNAIVFLENILCKTGDDGVPVPELKKAAEANGFSWRTIERAKKTDDPYKSQTTNRRQTRRLAMGMGRL